MSGRGDLHSQLNKFKQQHEKVQKTLTDVAASRKPPPAAGRKKSSASLPSAPARQPQNIASLTFQNDKEKLQQINQVRSSPVMSQVKRVIDVLFETRQSLLPDEINNLCYVDVKNNKDVFNALKTNVKVSFDGERLTYKAKHELKNKQELLFQLRKVPEGMPFSELKDAYPGIASDVQELKASGDIRAMCNSDSQEEILYADDPRVKIKVDEDITKLIRGIELPSEFVIIERELQKAGMRPMTNSTEKRERISASNSSQPKQKKKKKMSKRTKLTNQHLPELFNNLPPDLA